VHLVASAIGTITATALCSWWSVELALLQQQHCAAGGQWNWHCYNNSTVQLVVSGNGTVTATALCSWLSVELALLQQQHCAAGGQWH